jgi:hypothetical protein
MVGGDSRPNSVVVVKWHARDQDWTVNPVGENLGLLGKKRPAAK